MDAFSYLLYGGLHLLFMAACFLVLLFFICFQFIKIGVQHLHFEELSPPFFQCSRITGILDFFRIHLQVLFPVHIKAVIQKCINKTLNPAYAIIEQFGTGVCQNYPAPFSMFYPSEGNFIGFVGNTGSRRLVRRAIETFRQNEKFPSEGCALPEAAPGVGFSDQWSFWQAGYPAVMVTDTAMFRYPHYHTPEDTIDKIDFERTARVVRMS